MAAGIFVTLLVGSLFVMAFGLRRVLWRRSMEQSADARLKLDDLV